MNSKIAFANSNEMRHNVVPNPGRTALGRWPLSVLTQP